MQNLLADFLAREFAFDLDASINPVIDVKMGSLRLELKLGLSKVIPIQKHRGLAGQKCERGVVVDF